jgi:hypothetical protein
VIGYLLCLVGLHRGRDYPKRIGDELRVWRFCKRLGCNHIGIRRVRP